MKAKSTRFLQVLGFLVFIYYQLPHLQLTAAALNSKSFFNLENDTREAAYEPVIMEAFQHFPAAEKEFFFGDFNDQDDIFENHPLLDLTFPRTKNPQARCGFRKHPETVQPGETVLYSGALYVVCRS